MTGKMITTTQAFNLETIQVGDFAVVKDSDGGLIGTGIVTSVKHWQLILYLYTFTDNYNEIPLTRWECPIEAVLSGEVVVDIVDHLLFM